MIVHVVDVNFRKPSSGLDVATCAGSAAGQYVISAWCRVQKTIVVSHKVHARAKYSDDKSPYGISAWNIAPVYYGRIIGSGRGVTRTDSKPGTRNDHHAQLIGFTLHRAVFFTHTVYFSKRPTHPRKCALTIITMRPYKILVTCCTQFHRGTNLYILQCMCDGVLKIWKKSTHAVRGHCAVT